MLLKLYSKNNPPERIDKIVSILRDGGIIIYPTGTTYALGCHALKERAIERICKIRNINPAEHPLSVVCYDMSAISEYAHIPTPVFKIMKKNLPGPFTFILSGKNNLPKIFRSRKSGEIGIRMPDNPILSEILDALGAPLISVSLPSGDGVEEEYQTDPELIHEAYGENVDLVVDGGMGRMGVSTIVDCSNDDIEIVRQGDGVLI